MSISKKTNKIYDNAHADVLDNLDNYRAEAVALAEDALFRVEQAQKRAFEATSMGNIREAVKASKEASESIAEGIGHLNNGLNALEPNGAAEKKAVDKLGKDAANLINNVQSAAEDERELYREVREKIGDKKERIEAWKKLRTKMEQDVTELRGNIKDLKVSPGNIIDLEEFEKQKRAEEEREKQEQERIEKEAQLKTEKYEQKHEKRAKIRKKVVAGVLLYSSAKELRKAFRYKTPAERNQPDLLARLRAQGITTKAQVLDYMTTSWRAGEAHVGLRNSMEQAQKATQKENSRKQQKSAQIDAERIRKSMSASKGHQNIAKPKQIQAMVMRQYKG